MEICSRGINLLRDEFGRGVVKKDTGELIGYIAFSKFSN